MSVYLPVRWLLFERQLLDEWVPLKICSVVLLLVSIGTRRHACVIVTDLRCIRCTGMVGVEGFACCSGKAILGTLKRVRIHRVHAIVHYERALRGAEPSNALVHSQ